MICDWCGERILTKPQGKTNYNTLESYVNRPTVCRGCYKQISRQKMINAVLQKQDVFINTLNMQIIQNNLASRTSFRMQSNYGLNKSSLQINSKRLKANFITTKTNEQRLSNRCNSIQLLNAVNMQISWNIMQPYTL